MKQIFTSNDLLRFLYKELDSEEESTIKQQLETDTALAQELHLLLDGISLLEQADVSPGRALLQDLKSKLKLKEEQPSI